MFQMKIPTLLGDLIAVGDENVLYAIEFADENEKDLPNGKTKPLEQIERELQQYFKGLLKEFKTPLCFTGTPFQKQVWQELQNIPFGETRSYAEVARKIGKPTAFRAVAQANGANRFVIVVPCHRVINTGGALGGYTSGLKRKEWLLAHEK